MANQRDTVAVLVCCNAQHAQHMTVCLVSLLENNPDLRFDITAVTSFDNQSVRDKMARSISLYEHASVNLVSFQVPKDIRLSNRNYPRDVLARLWVAEFVDGAAHSRALYLDADMVVVSGIKELWHTDLGDKIFGAVTIPGSTRGLALGIPEQYGYFNNGLLLIDLSKWAVNDVKHRTLQFLKNSTMFLGTNEQDALNALFFDHRKCLDYVWNVISPFFWDKTFIPLSDERRKRICREAKILHFNGRSKPWSYMSRHPRKQEYFRYLQKTEWRDYRFPDRTLLNMFKKHVGILVPDALRHSLRRSWTL